MSPEPDLDLERERTATRLIEEWHHMQGLPGWTMEKGASAWRSLRDSIARALAQEHYARDLICQHCVYVEVSQSVNKSLRAQNEKLSLEIKRLKHI